MFFHCDKSANFNIMNNNQTRVLITAIGTMNCTTIISELKKAEEVFYVIGADINGNIVLQIPMKLMNFFNFPLYYMIGKVMFNIY